MLKVLGTKDKSLIYQVQEEDLDLNWDEIESDYFSDVEDEMKKKRERKIEKKKEDHAWRACKDCQPGIEAVTIRIERARDVKEREQHHEETGKGSPHGVDGGPEA